MLKKRIIPCLDIQDGRTVKGINFVDIIDAGDPVELAKRYVDGCADELVFLDITATIDKRKTLAVLVEKVAQAINIPFTVGGGISSVEDAKRIIDSGADKISVNSSAVNNPELVKELARELGSQCVVVAIDTKLINNNWKVFVKGGREETDLLAVDWANCVEDLGAGEILLTSMNNDGTKDGFAIDICKEITDSVNIPVIASGGAGNANHFSEVFSKTNVSAGLAASIFHFSEVSIPDLKQELKTQNILIR